MHKVSSVQLKVFKSAKQINSSHIGVHAGPVIKVHENGGPALVDLLLQDWMPVFSSFVDSLSPGNDCHTSAKWQTPTRARRHQKRKGGKLMNCDTKHPRIATYNLTHTHRYTYTHITCWPLLLTVWAVTVWGMLNSCVETIFHTSLRACFHMLLKYNVLLKSLWKTIMFNRMLKPNTLKVPYFIF